MSINSINGNTLLTSGSFPPVRAASTGSPLTPATGGLLVVDGVQLVGGDRVLCKDESSAINNGIYAASTGPWTRTSDAAGNQNFFSGMAVTVALGTVNAGLTYICTTTDDPVVIGTSLITFAAQSTVATATQSATSTTSLTIGPGSKTLTIQAGKAFAVNQWVLIQETSNSANQMLGQITGYSGASLTVNVVATGGSGTHADWTIVLTNSAAAAGFQPPVGSGNVTGPGSSTAGHVATFADGTGKVIQDGGALGALAALSTVSAQFLVQSAVAFGINMLNGTIVPSVAGNALTLAIKTLAGADPSASDPVWFVFRSATAGGGAVTVIEVTAALSTTVPASSTLGFANTTPGRIWIAAVNSAGTVSLAVINCLAQSGGVPSSIFPLAGWSIANITAYGAGANSAQTFFGTGSLSSVPYSVLGYVTWEAGSTLATAGQWSATPTRTELLRPGVPLPGAPLQPQMASGGSNTTSGSSTFNSTGLAASITLTSSANLVDVHAEGIGSNNTDTANCTIRLVRGATPIGVQPQMNAAANGGATVMSVSWLDFPQSLSSVAYTAQVSNGGGAGVASFPNSTGFIKAQEIVA